MKHSKTKQINSNRQAFLSTFFTGEGYEVKEVNGFILEKRIRGDNGEVEVGIYPQASWKKRNDATLLFAEKKNNTTHLLSL